MTNEELIRLAKDAMAAAYTPYSHFKVGAALETADGTVYTGCNIENAAYGPTVCAERVAIFQAVRFGHRSFRRIAIVGGKDGEISAFTYPCGVCRQVMREFCEDDFELIFTDGHDVKVLTLADLLPCSFSPRDLG